METVEKTLQDRNRLWQPSSRKQLSPPLHPLPLSGPLPWSNMGLADSFRITDFSQFALYLFLLTLIAFDYHPALQSHWTGTRGDANFIIASLITLIKKIMSHIPLAERKGTMEFGQYISTAEQENLVRMGPLASYKVPPFSQPLQLSRTE